MGIVAALDIGGHNIRCMLADEGGQVIRRLSTNTNRKAVDAEDNVGRLVRVVFEALAEVSAGPLELKCLSLGLPGVVDPQSGVVALVPNVPHWTDLNIRRRIQKHLPVPVILDNDVNLAARGEYWRGAAIGAEHFFFIAVGTGIGGGVFTNGKPYHGAHFGAGEIGYLALERGQSDRRIGDLGWFESVASGLALDLAGTEAAAAHPESILHSLSQASGKVTSADLFEADSRGDEVASGILDQATDYMALAVVNVTALLDPELIVFGGGMSAQGDRLLEPIQEKARHYGLTIPPLRLSRLGDEAQLFGALHAGLNYSGQAT